MNANLEPVWRTRQRLPIEGDGIWVVSRDELIQMKRASGRPQDLADMRRLEAFDR